MNVYDFDNTIYRGDSTVDLVLWCIRKRPQCIKTLPLSAVYGILYGLHIKDKLTFKKTLYRLFAAIPDMERVTDEFVQAHLHKIKPWYKAQQKEDDVVISASPEFEISRFCRAIGIKHVMASRVDLHTGEYDGINCHGEEKVRRFREVFGDAGIDEFYSDSYSDSPLAELAERAYLVKGDKRLPW